MYVFGDVSSVSTLLRRVFVSWYLWNSSSGEESGEKRELLIPVLDVAAAAAAVDDDVDDDPVTDPPADPGTDPTFCGITGDNKGVNSGFNFDKPEPPLIPPSPASINSFSALCNESSIASRLSKLISRREVGPVETVAPPSSSMLRNRINSGVAPLLCVSVSVRLLLLPGPVSTALSVSSCMFVVWW